MINNSKHDVVIMKNSDNLRITYFLQIYQELRAGKALFSDRFQSQHQYAMGVDLRAQDIVRGSDVFMFP